MDTGPWQCMAGEPRWYCLLAHHYPAFQLRFILNPKNWVQFPIHPHQWGISPMQLRPEAIVSGGNVIVL